MFVLSFKKTHKASAKSITSGRSWGTLHAGTKIFLHPYQ